jgi:glycosyltransferase involved in cell wall biosynthesis
VYARPSYNEGLPMSLLEAMAAGLPVLTTPIGGIPDAVRDGVEGWLVTPGDRVALAEALRKLFSDGAQRRAMGARARQRVESTFSAQVLLPQLEHLYRTLFTR